MVMILMALIVFAAIMIVGYPLVNAEQYGLELLVNGDDRLEPLAGARNSIFDAIRDLEFDHATGKLSDEDYRQMRARYDLRAAEILQKMDALTAQQTGLKKRSQKAGASKGSCPQCRAHVEPGDRFCPTCGARLA